ncbi:MAG: hypothetical protein M1298_03285 [Chloroflexi bacterium]|nr:hypothetical protein [Chloroflexota bacterium]
MPACLAGAPELPLQHPPQRRHILHRRRIQGVGNDRLLGTAGQTKGRWQRPVHPHGEVRVRYRLGASQQRREEHDELLGRILAVAGMRAGRRLPADSGQSCRRPPPGGAARLGWRRRGYQRHVPLDNY